MGLATCRAVAEPVADGGQQVGIGEPVAGAVQEEHGLGDLLEVFGARGAGLSRRVKREGVENETGDVESFDSIGA